jgi:hypothetical protein
VKCHFHWKFTADFDADTTEEACRAVAKTFEKETKPWMRPGLWRDQINKPDLDITKDVQVEV